MQLTKSLNTQQATSKLTMHGSRVETFVRRANRRFGVDVLVALPRNVSRTVLKTTSAHATYMTPNLVIPLATTTFVFRCVSIAWNSLTCVHACVLKLPFCLVSIFLRV